LSGVFNESLFHHFENKEAIAVTISLDVRRDYRVRVISMCPACLGLPITKRLKVVNDANVARAMQRTA
jgi:hypothetical protein